MGRKYTKMSFLVRLSWAIGKFEYDGLLDNTTSMLNVLNVIPYFAVHNAHFFVQICEGKVRVCIIHG